MLRFMLSIEEVLGDNVADMIACSTDKNLRWTPSSNATPTCSASEFTRAKFLIANDENTVQHQSSTVNIESRTSAASVL